jgi:peptide/nickel transport system substrate-binding protein
VTQVGQLPGFYTKVNAGLSFEHIDLNLKNEFLADKPLREAILRAINTQGVIDRTIGQFFDEAKPLLNHNYMLGSPHYKDVVSATGAGSGDIEAAKKVLTDAGYTGVGTALKTPQGKDVAPLRFRHTAGQANRATVGLLTQNFLKELGIEVKIETTEDLSGTLAQGDFDLIVFAWVKTPFVLSGAEQTYAIGSESNFGSWENPEANKVLLDAVTTLDETAAAELLNQANDMMAKDYYTLPLYQRPNFMVVRDTFANVRPNTTDYGPTYNIHEWGLRTTTAN